MRAWVMRKLAGCITPRGDVTQCHHPLCPFCHLMLHTVRAQFVGWVDRRNSCHASSQGHQSSNPGNANLVFPPPTQKKIRGIPPGVVSRHLSLLIMFYLISTGLEDRIFPLSEFCASIRVRTWCFQVDLSGQIPSWQPQVSLFETNGSDLSLLLRCMADCLFSC